jgi:hypothetical protein
MIIDTDQLASMTRDTIVAVSRESIPHVMALIIDRRLESMNDFPLSI